MHPQACKLVWATLSCYVAQIHPLNSSCPLANSHMHLITCHASNTSKMMLALRTAYLIGIIRYTQRPEVLLTSQFSHGLPAKVFL